MNGCGNNFVQDIPVSAIAGRTISFEVEVDLTNELDDLIMSCKVTKDDSEYVFQVSKTGGAVTYDSDTKTYYLRVDPSVTASVTPGKYEYDIVAVYGNDVVPLAQSNIWFDKGVTDNV